jgi:hypothetical protein
MLVSNRTDFEHLQMSIATLIILILLLAIIVGITIVVKMALSKLNTAPSSNSPSPAPAGGNSTASQSGSSGGSSSGKNPYGTWSIIPLAIAGLWLGAKIILFGGEINNVEIFVIAILSILAWGFDQKKWFISLVILVILGIKLLTPTEMEHIVIDRDGVYELPNRPLKVCFIKTGMPDRDFYMYQQIIIDSWSTPDKILEGCIKIPRYLSGQKVNISLGSAGKIYTPAIRARYNIQDDEIYNDYTYNFKNGIGNYPIIQAR